MSCQENKNNKEERQRQADGREKNSQKATTNQKGTKVKDKRTQMTISE
jgi:hypothetical protein